MAEIIAFNKGVKVEAPKLTCKSQPDQKLIRNAASDIQILANTLVDYAALLNDTDADYVAQTVTPLREALRELEAFVVNTLNPPKRPA